LPCIDRRTPADEAHDPSGGIHSSPALTFFFYTHRRTGSANDDADVRGEAASSPANHPLLALYDDALPAVYGYLVRRCHDQATAEDLTAETFMAAVSAVGQGKVELLTTAWLVGVARHKLIDHWRRRAREERGLRTLGQAATEADPRDQWDAELDPGQALETLSALGAHHQAALSLRYLDGLAVPEVAAALGRTVHATEALLVRARTAFRRVHGERNDLAD
jgi:RNA polymerase sigma-70 factor (ECF subfamily)